jgi:ketosteroid isomerase-like protein
MLPPAVRLALPAEASDPLDVYERFAEAQRAFYTGGPVAPVAALLAEHATWDVPGESAIAGHYAGRDAVLEYFTRRRDLADSTFTINTHRVLHDDRGVVAFAGGRATIGGRERAWETIGVYDVAEGHVVAGRLVPLDQSAFDEVWGSS